MQVLETQRLLLREFEEGDWEAVHRCFSDPEVMRFMLAAGPFTQEKSRQYVQQAMTWAEEQPRLQYALAVVLRAEGQFIGGYRLSVVDTRNREANIGFGLSRQHWRRGFATEAVRALLSFAFDRLDLHRVCAEVVAANAASVRVLEKVGMRREGHFREKARIEGEWQDCLHYALLDHEWRAAQAVTQDAPTPRSKTEC